MNNRRKIIVLLIAFAMVFTLASCGSVNMGAASAPTAPQSEGGFGLMPDYYASDKSYDYSVNEAEDYLKPAGIKEEESQPQTERKVIKNANLEIKTKDAAALYKNISVYAAGIGGYEHNYSISNYESYSVISAVFKIPPDKLDIFVNYIGENGEIINSSMNSDDVTESYYDAKTRLETKRRSLERYYDLLKDARGVEEIVYIQRTIDGITEDIESLEGRLKVWDSQVDMSTVSVFIRQDNDPIQIRKEISWNTLSGDDMGYLIKSSLLTIFNTVVSLIQWLAVILVGYSPVWLTLAAAIFIGVKLNKRRKKKDE
jgi:uncharacterized lipoprotein YehR (DUF1307 family)